MSDQKAPDFRKQRQCIWCSGLIAQSRPVYLVRNEDGCIIGPFHAGCAERMKIEAAKIDPKNPSLMPRVYGQWPSRREETLPW